MEPPQKTPKPLLREGALIAGAIVAASLILSWGMSGSQPHYQLAASGNAIVRMNTDSGEIIACTTGGCSRVEAPDRAKTLGAVGIKMGNSNEVQPAIEQKGGATKVARP